MQNYATDVLGKIDERFYLPSKTGEIINNGIELEFSNGNNAVTIYNVDVVAENDYIRSGVMRYGQLVELGTGVQTFVLSQDKSFAISIDRGNREDSKMIPAIDDAVKRQVREVSVPTTDIYRLGVLAAYAVAQNQFPSNATLSSSTIFGAILAQRAELLENSVSIDNLVVYLNPTMEMYLWQDSTFKVACDRTKADLATGKIGTVMGMDLIVVPSSYLPVGVNFIMLPKNVLVAPTKFNKIKTMDGDAFGIDGMVGFGRRYYDAFIPKNKGVAIRLHKKS